MQLYRNSDYHHVISNKKITNEKTKMVSSCYMQFYLISPENKKIQILKKWSIMQLYRNNDYHLISNKRN